MAFLTARGVRISGVSGAVPVTIEENRSLSIFTPDEAEKFIASTGVDRRHVSKTLLSSDFCVAAAERMIADLGWQRRTKMVLGVFNSGKMEEIKRGAIGYPGMKRQVSGESLKDILKILELDEEHGFDKKSIFEGAEPMYKLIQDYEGPLKRLRDK